MISFVTIIEFFESIFASIKRRNAEKAAVDAAKTGLYKLPDYSRYSTP
jgi:hypothetical protein